MWRRVRGVAMCGVCEGCVGVWVLQSVGVVPMCGGDAECEGDGGVSGSGGV